MLVCSARDLHPETNVKKTRPQPILCHKRAVLHLISHSRRGKKALSAPNTAERLVRTYGTETHSTLLPPVLSLPLLPLRSSDRELLAQAKQNSQQQATRRTRMHGRKGGKGRESGLGARTGHTSKSSSMRNSCRNDGGKCWTAQRLNTCTTTPQRQHVPHMNRINPLSSLSACSCTPSPAGTHPIKKFPHASTQK